jgi:hypothetical protein
MMAQRRDMPQKHLVQWEKNKMEKPEKRQYNGRFKSNVTTGSVILKEISLYQCTLTL